IRSLAPPPFLGEHALAVIQQASEKSAPKLRSVIPGFDRDLETICAKCLEREPLARYRSAADLAEDLERWLEGRSIIARRVASPVRVWRWSKRNPKLAVSLGIILVLGFVAVVRQFQSTRLQDAVTKRIAFEHSIEVTPVFNLDDVQEDNQLTNTLVDELRRSLLAIGPAFVRCAPEVEIAGGKPGSEIGQEQSIPMRSILCGTVRTLNGRRRISLRLLNGSNRAALLRRIFDLDSTDVSILARNISQDTYAILNATDLNERTEQNKDPGLRDKATRELI